MAWNVAGCFCFVLGGIKLRASGMLSASELSYHLSLGSGIRVQVTGVWGSRSLQALANTSAGAEGSPQAPRQQEAPLSLWLGCDMSSKRLMG
jgi:hypothetical protein